MKWRVDSFEEINLKEDKKRLIKSWKNNQWLEFSLKVKRRDNFRCLKCKKAEGEVILQVHHRRYIENAKPWEYPLSDCVTLCKYCHAVEHNQIEPNAGWYLLSVDDLGGLFGICERINCNNEIRYEHLIYHPMWGYKIVGSTCVEYLTQEDQQLSKEILRLYQQIGNFVQKSQWFIDITKKTRRYFIHTEYKYHVIRIYELENKFAIQIGLKEKGIKFPDFKEWIYINKIDLIFVKELSFIILRGFISENEREKELLRKIYKNTKNGLYLEEK
jgi:hypothetical protein